MNLLLVNNAGFIRDKQVTYITQTTGKFIEQFKSKFDGKVELFQFSQDGKVESGINNFPVSEDSFGLKTVPFGSGRRKILSYFTAFLVIIKTISRTNNFVYIFYPGHLSLMVAYACIMFNKPFGLYVRGEYHKKLSLPIFKKARFINTVGTIFRNEIQVNNLNCQVIRPMVQFNFFKKPTYTTQVRKKEILYVGRIEKRKGIWDLIMAAEILEKDQPDYFIRLVGSGEEFEEVSQHLVRKKMKNVILHGPIFNPKKLEKIYQQADIFLFPSHDEGFPRVLYEAMYFQLPIITTFVGNIPGLMKDNYNCLKISAHSPESIVEQVHKLVKNKSLRSQFIKNGGNSLKEMFNDSVKTHDHILTEQIQSYVK